MNINKNVAFLFVMSTIFALIEIEIEGKHGWAKKLPTTNIVPFSKVKYYHLYIFLFVSIMFTFIYGLNYFSIAMIIIFFFIEDFIWFILNPHYGVTKYTKKDIPWHKDEIWLLNQPIHNYIVILILIFISLYYKNTQIMYILVYSLVFIFFVTITSKLYHLFHQKTHKNVSNN